jgi:hypothetical protein
MFYDVDVSRTATATLTIRVEADGPNEAQDEAIVQARDEDFSGCCADYDFDVSSVVPVILVKECADGQLPDGLVCPTCGQKRQPSGVDGGTWVHISDERAVSGCAICGCAMPDDPIEADWSPQFWFGYLSKGPACPQCVSMYMEQDENGELVLKKLRGEFVSKWGNGHEFRSPCTVNVLTRIVEMRKHKTISPSLLRSLI